MKAPKRLKIRQPLSSPADFDITDIIPVFHRWIQEKSVPGLLIDVADYKHVPNGPGILLIGDEGDYSLDEIDGEIGLVYDRKRQTGEDLSESLDILIDHIEVARQALEAEKEMDLAATKDGAEIAILDRLQYPNNADVFDQVRQTLATKADASSGQTETLSHVKRDPRRPLTIKVQPTSELVTA